MTGYHIINALMIEIIIIIVNVVTGGKYVGSCEVKMKWMKKSVREHRTCYLHTVQTGNPQIRK